MKSRVYISCLRSQVVVSLIRRESQGENTETLSLATASVPTGMSADFANSAVLHYFKFMKAMPFYLRTRRTAVHLKNSSAVNCILHFESGFHREEPHGKIKSDAVALIRIRFFVSGD